MSMSIKVNEPSVPEGSVSIEKTTLNEIIHSGRYNKFEQKLNNMGF